MINHKSDKVQRLAIILLIIVVTCIAYQNVLNNRFINFDDTEYVTKNDHVHDGISVETIIWSFKSNDAANWHPLTWMSHALDCSLFGLDAKYHHAINLLLHLFSSIILFLVIDRMTSARWQSAFVALIFAVHPLHVESVAWIAERKDVLSGLFWMLTMYTYVRYQQSPSIRLYIIVLIIFALGLLAKPILVTLPFVLVLLDYWQFQRKITQGKPLSDDRGGELQFFKKSLYNKIPFFVLSILSSIITYIVQQQGGATKAASVSFPDRVANAIISYGQYLRKTVLPTDLSIFYPHPSNNIQSYQIGIVVTVLILFTVITLKLRSRQPSLLVGWFWYLGTLVPVIGLVQVGLQGMADRYMYIPIIGLSIIAVWGIPILIRHIQEYVLVSIFILVTLLMVLGTRIQVGYWKDSQSVFERALSVTAENYVAHNNLGAALADSGNHYEAINHLRESLRIDPNYIMAHHNLARSLLVIGERREALRHYTWILSHVPNDPRLHELIGNILADLGEVEKAINHLLEVNQLDPTNVDNHSQLGELYAQIGKYREGQNQCMLALKIEPNNSEAHRVLGIIAGRQQMYDEALKEFSEAIRFDTANANAYNDLGILYDRMGKNEKAIEMYRIAIRTNPHYINAQFNLGNALAKNGQLEEASLHWLRVIELEPSSVDARVNLGRLYTMQGKHIEAIQQFTEALHVDPNNFQAHYNYGNLLTQLGKFPEAEQHYTEAIRLSPTSTAVQAALQHLSIRKNQKK